MSHNALGLSCAHEALTKDRPQSAKDDFKKRRVLGVSLKPLCTPGMGVILWGASPLYGKLVGDVLD